MASDLLGISVSGLKVSQAALRTVGHNIANAGTDGYSRQRIDPAASPANNLAGNYIGNGAKVNSIDRVVNQFVVDQLRTDTSLASDLNGYYDQVRQLDNLLSSPTTGLSGSMTSFFQSLQNGADDPTSIPARQLIVSESENLADRFNTLYQRLESIGNGVEEGMEAAVEHINSLASNIAQLNQKISHAMGATNNASPNDLLDQRDQALTELAALLPVQTFDQGGGQINVSVGNGQSLVLGGQAARLEVAPGAVDAERADVYFVNGQRRQAITANITSGELGGLVRFRDEVLEQTYNKIGQTALVLADSMNKQHQKGLDLDGDFGGQIFFDVNEQTLARNRVSANSGNPTTTPPVASLYLRDSSRVTASDYEVKIEQGGLYRVIRNSDNKDVAGGLVPSQTPFSISFDGLELEFERGTLQAGDRFQLQPTRTGAKDFHAVIDSPENIAFASPLVTDTSLGNQGSGTISAGQVLSFTDVDGNELPLFAAPGSMDPPLMVVFNTPYSFDVLDNSDPGNPVHLNPPIRDQRYVPGMENPLFPAVPGQTLVSTRGEMIGLPDGRGAVTTAALLPGGVAPDLSVSSFSGSGDQFSFELMIGNTSGGINDGTFTVTVNSAALTDTNALVQHINSQLSGSDARAYLADDGSLAFRLQNPGHGNITLQNYDADPDGGGDLAPAGQANNLLGFDIEGASWTTVNNEDGQAGQGSLGNGYPAEVVTISQATGVAGQSKNTRIITGLNASAKETANLLNKVGGVQANAFTYAEITDLNLTAGAPLQLTLNGEALLEYSIDSTTGESVLAAAVPDPSTDPDGFKDYLTQRINENPKLKSAGIYAVAGADALTGASELRLFASEGDDLKLAFTGAAGDTLAVGDGENSPVDLTAMGNSVSAQIVVGGQLDVRLAEGTSLGTLPPESMLFGNTRSAGFAQSTYLGIQASITGTPAAGDRFTLDFNSGAASDNRNALALANLQQARSFNGNNATFNENYGALVESIGITTHSAKINRDAAEQVMQQTQTLRDSISGVNLDEEAADLIRFEQMFSANAQVISVARDVFDRLINSF